MMPTKQHDEQPAVQEKEERRRRDEEKLKTVIGDQVMQTVGRPGNLHTVQVRHLWDDCYRVNVFVGVDAASAKVAHSFFLMADSDGTILKSTPKITRQY
jgi:hypothetical protein